ncbi:MAG: hypothetical protein FIA91_09175 [Geobacter sp.]|nr:hypothetical protein [Geobacter sp.]
MNVSLLIRLCAVATLTVSAPLYGAEANIALPAAEQQILLKETPVKVDKPLFDCLQAMPSQKVLTLEELDQKRLTRLKELAKAVASQHAAMVEFEGYVKWMGSALAGYSKYVEAGSFAAGFAKYLPVPYAGQAGQLSKFIAHFALSLSETSASVKQFIASASQFTTSVDGLGASAKGKESEMAALVFLADQKLTREMLDLQTRLETTSGLSASALSFLLGLQQYLGSTDEYWQKTKSLVSRKDADKAEKGALAGSIDGLRSRAEEFNKRLKGYDENVRTIMPVIASLVTYEELRQDIAAK